MLDRLDVIERNLADILATTATFRAHSDFYEDLVRKQQQRIETLQTDQIQALLGPILQGLAALLTQASDAANRALARGDDRQVFDDFIYFHDAVEQALGLVGVNSVGALPGGEFDRATHAARRSIDTPDEALGGTIARVMRQGLVREGGERAFLPAQVTVYRYKAPDPVGPEADLFPNFGTDANQRGDNA
ncbi:hypothetical protein CGZ95_18615 [Enemella evansiae]|nr:hypothetical protein CGZ95_18615 [Enemella evansiae]